MMDTGMYTGWKNFYPGRTEYHRQLHDGDITRIGAVMMG